MNAKELRAAADELKRYSEELIRDRLRLLPGQARREMDYVLQTTIDLSTHILATVREDDDDEIKWDWLESVTGNDREVSGSLVSVHVTEELSLVGDLEYPNVWQVWFNEYEIGECVDRAGFRSLCRGLGIKLKETT